MSPIRLAHVTEVASTTKATFAGNMLKAGGDYTFFCSFPGHAALMKGKLVVTK